MITTPLLLLRNLFITPERINLITLTAFVCHQNVNWGDAYNAELAGKPWMETPLRLRLQKWAEDAGAALLGDSSHPSSTDPCLWPRNWV